VVFCKL